MSQPIFSLDDFERSLVSQIRVYAASLKAIRQAKKSIADAEKFKQDVATWVERDRELLESSLSPPITPTIDGLTSNRGHWIYPNR